MNFKFILIIILFSSVVIADVKLASLFTDNMVLQRNRAIHVWGVAEPGEVICLRLNSQKLTTTADDNGDWKISLSPMAAGGPFEFIVEGMNKITLKNVMIGEVWICSGQSNMEFPLNKSKGGNEEISEAKYDMIRVFIVKHHVADDPQNFCEGEWKICSQNTISQFSGVAYFFGKNLLKELNVPIGLIQTTWGGSPAEAWMSEEVLKSDEDFIPILTNWDNKMKDYPSLLDEFNRNEKRLIDEWKYDSLIAANKRMAPPRKPSKPDGPGTRNQPAGLFNGMIYPLHPFSFQGVIWYQGEANAGRAHQYRKLFPALIKNWRELWNEGDFPFLYVQLPNLNRQPEPSNSGWAELRESQLMTLSLPNTGMAVTIDIGDPMDLHPSNKKDVGIRLSLIALNKVYSKPEIICSGPIYSKSSKDGNKFLIEFSHSANGLKSKDGNTLRGFKITGDGKIFLDAHAEIKDNIVIVWNDSISNPISVRYAWADNLDCNLVNSADLPASPFRTDDWPEVTFGKK